MTRQSVEARPCTDPDCGAKHTLGERVALAYPSAMPAVCASRRFGAPFWSCFGKPLGQWRLRVDRSAEEQGFSPGWTAYRISGPRVPDGAGVGYANRKSKCLRSPGSSGPPKQAGLLHLLRLWWVDRVFGSQD